MTSPREAKNAMRILNFSGVRRILVKTKFTVGRRFLGAARISKFSGVRRKKKQNKI